MLSRNLEKSLHRALAQANERNHEFATLEHLLFALLDDEDATKVLKACDVDMDALRLQVLNYIDEDLSSLVVLDPEEDAKPKKKPSAYMPNWAPTKKEPTLLSTSRIDPPVLE